MPRPQPLREIGRTIGPLVLALGIAAALSRVSVVDPDPVPATPARSGSWLNPEFEIVAKAVVPATHFQARVEVLGAEFGYGPGRDLPVTVEVGIGSESFGPFGPPTSPTLGSVNDGRNPRGAALPGTYPAGTPIHVVGRSFSRWARATAPPEPGRRHAGLDRDFRLSMTVDTRDTPPTVMALRDGDPLPDRPAIRNQAEISDLVRDHVDPATGRVRLRPDQVLYLFELGTADLRNPAADFQDLVVLLTLAAAGPGSGS